MTLYDVLMEQALMYGAGMAMELKKKLKKKLTETTSDKNNCLWGTNQ